MNREELITLRDLIDDQVAQIVHSQMVFGEVAEAVDERRFRPFEDDHIMEAHFGEQPIEPQTHEIGGVEFVTRVLHRRGARQSDIKGADLLYEIEGVKYLLIQYKLADQNGNVRADIPQLDEISSNCPVGRDYGWCPLFPLERLIGWCGSWFGVLHQGDARFMRACEARRVFGNIATRPFEAFRRGLSRSTFDELFASCRLGAHTAAPDIASYTAVSLNADHLLYTVLQRGRF